MPHPGKQGEPPRVPRRSRTTNEASGWPAGAAASHEAGVTVTARTSDGRRHHAAVGGYDPDDGRSRSCRAAARAVLCHPVTTAPSPNCVPQLPPQLLLLEAVVTAFAPADCGLWRHRGSCAGTGARGCEALQKRRGAAYWRAISSSQQPWHPRNAEVAKPGAAGPAAAQQPDTTQR